MMVVLAPAVKKTEKIDFKEYKTYESDLEMEKMADYDGNGRLSSAEEKLFTEMQKNSVSSTWFTLGNVNFNIQKNELANRILYVNNPWYAGGTIALSLDALKTMEGLHFDYCIMA